MKTVPSEFSNSAWNYFIFAKEIAYKNHQQNVNSDNLLLALIKEDNITKNILKKNNVNLKDLESEIISCLLYTSPSPRDRYGSRMPSSA